MRSIGLDFGTTNSVMTYSEKQGEAEAFIFRHGGHKETAFRSALSFWQDLPGMNKPVSLAAGPWAIEQFAAFPDDTRFLQSFKTFAASPYFQFATIFNKRYSFETLLQLLFQKMQDHQEPARDLPPRLVVGRPVRFAGHTPNAALAHDRYEAAFRPFGFQEILYVYEPLAASYFYAQGLTQDAIILVADFGGGTSDFSIVRFVRHAGQLQARPLGHAGIAIAGDTFDYRIIDHIVSPALGKDSSYRSWDKILPMPISFYKNFARWNELCLMNTPKTLRELQMLAKSSLEPEKIKAFIDLLEANIGFQLYQNVSNVKTKLSAEEVATFDFAAGNLSIKADITREAFEGWIAEDLNKLGATLDELLAECKLAPHEIDRIFLTGGTSFIPAIRKMFEIHFPSSPIETGEQLLSIAKGLALIGEEEDVSPWVVGNVGGPAYQ